MHGDLIEYAGFDDALDIHAEPFFDEMTVDSLTAFHQSNQICSSLLSQLTQCRVELPDRREGLREINKHFEGGAMMDVEAQHLHEQAARIHGYLYDLDGKINKITLHLMNQVETSCNLMARAMHSLVADKLVEWLVKQKEISCGPRATIKAHYELLDAIDMEFEECGRQITFLINLVNNFHACFETNPAHDVIPRLHKCRTDLIQNSRQFVWQSLVVAIQPPGVLVKCRGSDSHRSTRFPCKTEVRLLGGDALGIRANPSTVRVELISEEVARQIQQDPCRAAASDQSFHLIYNESRFEVDDMLSKPGFSVCRATFDRIRLVESSTATKRPADTAMMDERKGTRRSKVSSLRYYLAFQIELSGLNYIEVSGYKLSLPVAALVHSSLEAEASLFWNRSFADGTGILSSVPDAVPWCRLRRALSLKWGALVQEPQDVKDLTLELPEPMAPTHENLDHLARRLGVSGDGTVHRKCFFNKTVAYKENKDGGPLPCVFYEWFYKCASIVNKYMQTQWDDGLIAGFCSKESAERQLRNTMQPTMLIRFSDMIVGHLKISCRLPSGRVVHYETEADKMPLGTTIADALRCNPTFGAIKHIYPNRRVSLLWQDSERQEETRTESWTSVLPPGYFDNVYTLESKPVAAIDLDRARA